MSGIELVNAKDFGAVGDGITDDTLPLRSWLAAGTNGNIHKLDNTPIYAGKKCYLPPGNYRTTDSVASLPINSGFGVEVFGHRFISRIFNDNGGSVFKSNGLQYSSFRDLRLSSVGPATVFDWDWDGTGSASQQVEFSRIYFDGGANGLRCGFTGGNMCSEGTVSECFFAGFTAAGLSVVGQNSLNHEVIRSTFQNNYRGIDIDGGSISRVCADFEQSGDTDIAFRNYGNKMVLAGIRTESQNFYRGNGDVVMLACGQNSPGPGTFANIISGSVSILDCSSTQGQIIASPAPKLWVKGGAWGRGASGVPDLFNVSGLWPDEPPPGDQSLGQVDAENVFYGTFAGGPQQVLQRRRWTADGKGGVIITDLP